MFRDDSQACAVACVLVRSGRPEDLWTTAGPTDLLLEMLENDVARDDMRRIAFDLWNGGGKVGLALMVETLPRPYLALVASLMAAMACGFDAVDEWLAKQRQ